jgi:putative ATPase
MNNHVSIFKKENITPLAERMRPQNFDDFVGQNHILGTHSFFRKMVESNNLSSCIFWGPPGCGKTTLANIVSKITERRFFSFNAVFNGVKDIRNILEQAKTIIDNGGKSPILFVDEIHRFNKSQQDAFLQPLEKGIIILIGATTENPSFEINSALLSRCSVYTLNLLQDKHIEKIINLCLQKELADKSIELHFDAKKMLVNYANGDARCALNALEIAVNNTPLLEGKRALTEKIIKSSIQSRKISYDKNGEGHYNLISALHKSLRGSDVQAALYWLARMIEGGADPLYISRRLVRFASEDIGLADPNALMQAIATQQAVHFLGYPECDNVLAQCIIYLATAPKSNASYVAIKKAKAQVQEKPNDPVPMHIRNAPTKLMKDIGYGKGYQYDHDKKNNFSGQSFLPDSMQGCCFYEPGGFGFEREIKKRIDYWEKLKKDSC